MASRMSTAYASQFDRDLAVDGSYSLPVEGTMLSYVSRNAELLAEEFWRERPNVPAKNPSQAVRMWESVKFGRELEPSAHGILWREVRLRLDGARRRRDVGLFADASEAAAWLDAVRRCGGSPGAKHSLDWMDEVAAAVREREPGEDDD